MKDIEMTLLGKSIVGCGPRAENDAENGATFSAVNPATGKRIDPVFHSASGQDVQLTAQLADEAFAVYGKLPGKEKGVLLRHIAHGIEGITEQLVERAHQETALPEKRLQGEVARTANQLRLFAEVIEEGSWSMARNPSEDRSPVSWPSPHSPTESRSSSTGRTTPTRRSRPTSVGP